MALQTQKNSDGTLIVELPEPVSMNGETYTRLTIPKIKGKHLKKCPISVGSDGKVNIGNLVEFASIVVTPAGIVDELEPGAAMEVASLVASFLGV